MPSPYYDAVIADSPISYWRLGEASGTVAADVMGANVGAYAGALTLGAPGGITGDANTGVDFSGYPDKTGVVTVAHSASLAFGAAMSVELLVKNTYLAGYLVMKSLPSWDWGLYWGGTTGGYEMLMTITDTSANQYTAHSGLVGNGLWSHVVATYDSALVRIYVNGSPVGVSLPTVLPIRNSSGPLYIGAEPGLNAPMTGTYDEVAVYNHALTPGQVLTHAELVRPRGPVVPPKVSVHQSGNSSDGWGR